MKILITGAGGFFGKALTRAFTAAGHQVLAADLYTAASFTPRPGSGEVRYVQLNVADPTSWEDSNLRDVWGVVHAAALTPSAEEVLASPRSLLTVNLGGALNALEFARSTECSKFLFISSAGVYDQTLNRELAESDADGGSSLYGSAKLAAELVVRRYGRMYDLDVGAVRPTSLYGPAELMTSARPFVTQVKMLVDAAAQRRSVRLQGLDARCDWVYVDDAADAAVALFAVNMRGRVFNVSAGQPVAFRDVVTTIQSRLAIEINDDSDYVVDGGPDRPAVIANESARVALGWAPQHDLAAGVGAYLVEDE